MSDNASLTANGEVFINNGSLTLNGALRVSGNITGTGAITVAEGSTLDIGNHTLTAASVTGGILKATLTDAATTSPIVTAAATDVTLVLNMDAASRNDVTLYHITDGTGFTFGDYDTKKFAVSADAFDKSAAQSVGVLDGWTGGDLYILRLTTAGEDTIEDLVDQGIPVSETERKAVEALNDEVVDALAPAQQAAAQKVNDLLETARRSFGRRLRGRPGVAVGAGALQQGRTENARRL